MSRIPLDTSCEAEYEDGYVHSETELDDTSAFEDGRNVFYDILERRLEAEHGRMVRFSVFYQGQRYDVDWTTLPDNARPIRFRHGYNTLYIETGETESGWLGVSFGYQYNDETGKNHKEIIDL